MTAAMVGNGVAGAGAVDAWVKPRQAGGRAHPRRDPRDRRLRADAVEAVGGGELARGSGAGVRPSFPSPTTDRAVPDLRCVTSLHYVPHRVRDTSQC